MRSYSFFAAKPLTALSPSIRTNSSPEPSRSYMTWLLLLLCCTHSGVAKLNSLLLPEHADTLPTLHVLLPLTATLFFHARLSPSPPTMSFFKHCPLRLTLVKTDQDSLFPLSTFLQGTLCLTKRYNYQLCLFTTTEAKTSKICFAYWCSSRTKNCAQYTVGTKNIFPK